MEQYEKIQQLLKKEPGTKERVPIFPPTVIQAVFDAKTGASLEAILAQFNSVFVQYQGTAKDTRMLIPADMRRPGLIITYVNAEGETVSERASLHGQADDEHWALDVNWSRIDELSLSGDIAVSARGTWIINGADTGIKAVGPKGENGITPWLKEIDNKLHYSYDNVKWTSCSGPLSAQFRNHNNHVQVSYDKGKTWTDISDPVATYVRFAATSSTSQDGSIGKLQYSHDKATWHDLSPEFRNYLRIQGYVATQGKLPTGVPVGTIYGVGPFYEVGDINSTNPMYQLQVWDGTQWVHNGRFNSIAAGIVQETGDSETEVMSQKAVSEKLSELGSEVAVVADINVSFINDKLWNSGTGTLDNYPGRICTQIMPYNAKSDVDTDGIITDFVYWKNGVYIGESKTYGGFPNANQISWNYKKDALPTYATIKGNIKSKLDNIDKAPMPNSMNLSYSGGIESRIIKSENGFPLQGYYYDNNGKLQKHDTIRCTELLPINDESYVISFNTSGGSSYGNFVFFDEDKNFISVLLYSNKPNGELCILTNEDFPLNAKYVAANADNTDKYLSPFIIITNYSGINNYLGNLLLGERVISNWTDAGTPSKSYYSELIPVAEGCAISTMNPYVSFFRVILYDAGKHIIYNPDISFKDGEAKGEGGISGRFEGHTYNIPLGYGISYVKLQYLEENPKPNIFINYKRIGTQLAELYCGVNAVSGQKVVTIGDSLTENCVWQPYLAKYKNLKWSKEETLSGVGYVSLVDGSYTTEDKNNDINYRKAYPMAIGGTTMRPHSEKSIYIRALDAVHYNPDIIIIYGGENDGISMVTGSNPWGDSNLSAKELVEQTSAYKEGVVSTSVNAMAAYKGLIEMLSARCPKAKIYLVAPMRCRCEIGMTATGGAFEGVVRFKDISDVIDYDNKDRLKRWGYIKALGEYYGLPVIDLMNDCGATHYNEKDWYSGPAYDCTQVHPNDYGYMMMAKCMATYF